MNINDTAAIRSILSEANELTDGDFSYYLTREESFEWPEKTLFPASWSWEIVELNDKLNYDSYGYGQASGSYLVFKVSDGEQEQLYYIPGSYASYDGWNWEMAAVTKTVRTEKTILVWSSID